MGRRMVRMPRGCRRPPSSLTNPRRRRPSKRLRQYRHPPPPPPPPPPSTRYHHRHGRPQQVEAESARRFASAVEINSTPSSTCREFRRGSPDATLARSSAPPTTGTRGRRRRCPPPPPRGGNSSGRASFVPSLNFKSTTMML